MYGFKMHLALHLLLESSLQIPSVFPELQKATRNVRVTVVGLFSWFRDGGGVAEERGWRGHSAEKEEEGGGLSVLGDRWRGGLVHDGLVLDGLHVL